MRKETGGFLKKTGNPAHFSLLGPAKNGPRKSLALGRSVCRQGTDAVLVGGSDSLYSESISETVSC
jgi:heptaprenylglyceryl phosphate synthase